MARWEKKFPLSKDGKLPLWRIRLERRKMLAPDFDMQASKETTKQAGAWARLMTASRRAAE